MSPNPASILDSVKKVIGLADTDTTFDLDVTMFINSAFGSLQQLGIGPKTGFVIIDNTLLWSDYSLDTAFVGMIQNFVFLSVKIAFDPPDSRFTLPAYQKLLEELTWRLNIRAEQVSPPSDPFTAAIAAPYFWDLTGLSDFPDDAAVGDVGIDFTTGDVWRKTV